MCHSLPMGLYGTHQPGASQISDRDNDVIIHQPACLPSACPQRSVDESIPLQTNWFTVIIQALLSVSIDLPRELRPSKKQPRMFFLSPTHTACPSSVCNALTSLRAASKLLFSEVSQIENEGDQMRTTRSSQRRDAESTQSQLKNSVCSVFFFFPLSSPA